MSLHALKQLTCSTTPYNERTDPSDKANKVNVWASAVCECGNTSGAYIWVEARFMAEPKVVTDLLGHVSGDAAYVHELHQEAER